MIERNNTPGRLLQIFAYLLAKLNALTPGPDEWAIASQRLWKLSYIPF